MFFNDSNVVQIKGESQNGFDALKLLEANKYDLILMDINFSKKNGVDAIHQIIGKYPNIKILANYFHDNLPYILGVIKAGAKGYITKADGFDVYLKSIIEICKGKCYMSDEFFQVLFNEFEHSPEKLRMN